MSEKVVLHEGKYLRLVRRGHWEFAERTNSSGVVGIVAITDDRKLILVEQFRAPVNKTVVELPAGLSGDIAGQETEALAEAAKRELLEETGYEATEMIKLADGASSAGMCSEVLTLFFAKGLKKVHAGGGDESETIVIHEIPVNDVPGWLDERMKQGKILDFKVYAALFFATHLKPDL